ncbi:MAG: NAD(P)H-hydrate dehydratase [Bacteroidales bacterium]|nr:NAD(P)H-hydrate dehydratase [Bacteroidales bacterium]
MKIFKTSQIRDIDAYTIEHEPVASIDLMERAATACADWLSDKFDHTDSFVILAGPGNNGGDGWAIARLLADRGYTNIRMYLTSFSGELSADSAINRKRLTDQNRVPVFVMESAIHFPALQPHDIVIDSLFGSGLSRPLSGLAAELVKHVNTAGCKTIAVDIPSGLMGEDNTGNTIETIIRADFTLTFQFPKLAFFFPENEQFIGDWTILDIGLHRECIEKTPTPYYFILQEEIATMIRPRRKFSHKGTYGHALLIAGSYGMMGASVLASKACLRTGAGLVTVHIPQKGYEIIQSSVPEAIVSLDPAENCFSVLPDLNLYDAVGIGPGIGTHASVQHALNDLLLKCSKPLVIDADALNIMGIHKELLDRIPENSIITPHPREFERIAGTFINNYDRLMKQIDFARHYKIIVIIKGANTSVVLPDGRCYFNSTGNPGMATGGSGDVLTGIILSLLAQGYETSEAARTGVYLHGLAGDLAAQQTGQQALIASDITENIGNAFLKTENR